MSITTSGSIPRSAMAVWGLTLASMVFGLLGLIIVQSQEGTTAAVAMYMIALAMDAVAVFLAIVCLFNRDVRLHGAAKLALEGLGCAAVLLLVPMSNREMKRSYSQGFNVGHANGYSSGTSEGFADGYAKGQTSGYSKGLNAGKDAGYSVGRNEGESAGYASGYVTGQSSGFAFGFNNGAETQLNQDRATISRGWP